MMRCDDNGMILYKTYSGAVIERDGRYWKLTDAAWDDLLARDDLPGFLARAVEAPGAAELVEQTAMAELQVPVDGQEVWAAGVTYYRSRDARMAESEKAGGGSFYDRVYDADRPELFFKATIRNAVGHHGQVQIRSDSQWNVPEPELTVVASANGTLVGYTIGNDVSSRDIEGENPLYLPQAKVYDGSCALGPGILIQSEALPRATPIQMSILRDGALAFSGTATLADLKRTPETLVDYLFRQNSFPVGCLLMTGTGIVPPDSFTLEHGDQVHITIEPIGTLVNTVA